MKMIFSLNIFRKIVSMLTSGPQKETNTITWAKPQLTSNISSPKLDQESLLSFPLQLLSISTKKSLAQSTSSWEWDCLYMIKFKDSSKITALTLSRPRKRRQWENWWSKSIRGEVLVKNQILLSIIPSDFKTTIQGHRKETTLPGTT